VLLHDLIPYKERVLLWLSDKLTCISQWGLLLLLNGGFNWLLLVIINLLKHGLQIVLGERSHGLATYLFNQLASHWLVKIIGKHLGLETAQYCKYDFICSLHSLLSRCLRGIFIATLIVRRWCWLDLVGA
jgi:hypothetical protein